MLNKNHVAISISWAITGLPAPVVVHISLGCANAFVIKILRAEEDYIIHRIPARKDQLENRRRFLAESAGSFVIIVDGPRKETESSIV